MAREKYLEKSDKVASSSNCGCDVYMIAGEPSGDFLGAQLMKALRKNQPQLKIEGVGGYLMREEGLSSLFDIKEISVMGVFEILPKLRKILTLIHKTIADIALKQPKVLVTIDSPGFNLKVARKIKALCPNTKLIHYVAPSVWAYKPSRVHKFRKVFHELMCLLPFEPPLFTQYRLKAHFVGHPIVESDLASLLAHSTPQQESSLGRARNNKLLLLPGSRKGEITKLLPIFVKVCRKLLKIYPELEIEVPTVPHFKELVSSYLQGLPAKMVVGQMEKYQSMLTARLALAASGTVTLELALAQVKTVVAYKMNPLTTMLAAMLLKVKYVSLINILCGKAIFPERLGPACTVSKIYNSALTMLNNPLPLNSLAHALQSLGYHQFVPSERAAKVVLEASL